MARVNQEQYGQWILEELSSGLLSQTELVRRLAKRAGSKNPQSYSSFTQMKVAGKAIKKHITDKAVESRRLGRRLMFGRAGADWSVVTKHGTEEASSPRRKERVKAGKKGTHKKGLKRGGRAKKLGFMEQMPEFSRAVSETMAVLGEKVQGMLQLKQTVARLETEIAQARLAADTLSSHNPKLADDTRAILVMLDTIKQERVRMRRAAGG